MSRQPKDFITGNALIANDYIETDRVAKGNYKFVNIDSLTITLNEDIPNTINHETGSRAACNARIEIIGSAKVFGLANIQVYCKANGFYYESDMFDYRVVTGKQNKYHAITSLLKILAEYSNIDNITADIFDDNTNDYLYTKNLASFDVVKYLQAGAPRGYGEKIITSRADFIPKK